jgi:hypothetical protein
MPHDPDEAKRGSRWYREEAGRVRERGDRTVDPDLRAHYLNLADAYDRLADTLDPLKS